MEIFLIIIWLLLRWPSCRRWRRSWPRPRRSSELENKVSHRRWRRVHTHSGGSPRHRARHPPPPTLRLLQLRLRGPPGCLHDGGAKRGRHGCRGAPQAPPARGRPAQRCPAAPQAGGAHPARPDALAAAEVRRPKCRRAGPTWFTQRRPNAPADMCGRSRCFTA